MQKFILKMRYTVFTFLAALLLLVSCNSNKTVKENQKPVIVATTSMLTDALINLVGDSAEIIGLMGPGVDPHLYQASPGDLKKMQSADVIVYNGLFLEGKLGSILENLSKKKEVINFSDGVPKELFIEVSEPEYENEIYDPHIWFSIDIWKKGTNVLANKLATLYPELKPYIAKNAQKFDLQLGALKMGIQAEINQIPEEKRILITSHDAFQYFGRMLGIQVEALQGLSTATEFGLQDRKRVVDLIIDKDINAIFIESSVSEKPIEAIIEDCKNRGKEVKNGGSLFSDAMGEQGTVAGTYLGMIHHNVSTIVNGWK